MKIYRFSLRWAPRYESRAFLLFLLVVHSDKSIGGKYLGFSADCVSLSRDQLVHIRSSYLLFGTSSRSTFWYTTQWPLAQEIIIFIKGNLFFNRYFFIFLSRLSSSQVFCMNHCVCVGRRRRRPIENISPITSLINGRRFQSQSIPIAEWHSLLLHCTTKEPNYGIRVERGPQKNNKMKKKCKMFIQYLSEIRHSPRICC